MSHVRIMSPRPVFLRLSNLVLFLSDLKTQQIINFIFTILNKYAQQRKNWLVQHIRYKHRYRDNGNVKKPDKRAIGDVTINSNPTEYFFIVDCFPIQSVI